jgi:hypothetical protein
MVPGPGMPGAYTLDDNAIVALVVLLRGLNVGGHRRLRPATLAKQLQQFGIVNIGATGTFVVQKRVVRARLRAEIARRLPFKADIMICDGREIVRLIAHDVFADAPARSDVVRFVSVLSRRPRRSPRLPIRFPTGGRWLLKVLVRDGRFVLGVYRRHMKVIGYLGQLDKIFGTPATTRSWGTLVAVGRVVGQHKPGVRDGPGMPGPYT